MQALIKQFQVVHALVLRETRTRFGRNRLGYLWALLEPVLFIGVFVAMYSYIDRPMPAGLPMAAFLVTGFIPYFAFQRTATQNMNAINGNKGLLFYPTIRPLDLVAARTSLEVATTAVVFVLLSAAAAAWEGFAGVQSLLLTVAGVSLCCALGAGLGLIFCGLTVFSTAVERLVSPLMRPLFWVSALFFSTNEMPTDAQQLLLYNPLLHAIELTREGWFPGYHVPQVSLLYPTVWVIVFAYFGLVLERVARRRLEVA